MDLLFSSIPTFPDYPGVSRRQTESTRSPVRVTKAPGQYQRKRIKYIFQTYFGRFLAFFGENILDISSIFMVELAKLYFEELT
jgi:hypothetical protein